jgi:hypothetical protein
LLPLFSDWRSVDAWGLNDQWIAHHGSITEEYLDQNNPTAIAFHARVDELSNTRNPDPWSRMVQTLKAYASGHNYVLAAAFGMSPADLHYYYVKAGLPDTPEIIEKIRALDYSWYDNGVIAKNYVSTVGDSVAGGR